MCKTFSLWSVIVRSLHFLRSSYHNVSRVCVCSMCTNGNVRFNQVCHLEWIHVLSTNGILYIYSLRTPVRVHMRMRKHSTTIERQSQTALMHFIIIIIVAKRKKWSHNFLFSTREMGFSLFFIYHIYLNECN